MSDARWGDPRDYDARDRSDDWPRIYNPRDRDENDPRDGLMRDLDLPRGHERELIVDRDRVYDLDGEDSRTLAALGAFRVVPEHDLDVPHDTVENLRDQRLIELVDLGDSERGLTSRPTAETCSISHSLERDRAPSQMFYAGVSRSREIDHDSNLYATFRQEEARLRDEHDGLEIRRVILEQDLKREYQECSRRIIAALTPPAARRPASAFTWSALAVAGVARGRIRAGWRSSGYELAAVLASHRTSELAVLPLQKAAGVDHDGHDKLAAAA